MKIGYACVNLSIGCTSARTFRLKSYSQERLVQTVAGNLACLQRTLAYNVAHGLLFFRITSDLVPFASHPVCQVDWRRRFCEEFAAIGATIREHDLRISMHPDQFTLINAQKERIHAQSVAELHYHVDVLEAMDLGPDAKIQIHVGGVYGDRPGSLARFCDRYEALPQRIRARLVVENDDQRYSLAECLWIHECVGIPVLFDNLHHAVRNEGETLAEGLQLAAATWTARDGLPMVDYSSQDPDKRPGAHRPSIDTDDFAAFARATRATDYDLMLEIKDKEASALQALAVMRGDARLVGV